MNTQQFPTTLTDVIVILVHGCFWHGHSCPMFKLPATRRDFWGAKIAGNQQRDEQALMRLSETGWRALTVWECSVRGRARLSGPSLVEQCAAFLTGDMAQSEIKGNWESLVPPNGEGDTVSPG